MKFTPYEGQAIRTSVFDSQAGLAELQFNLKDDSVNKFNATTLKELREAVDTLKKSEGVKGLLLTSGKDVFIVGADVTEFLGYFAQPEDKLASWLKEVNATFSDLEDLPFPTLAMINGFALGGGFELCLSTSYRVMSAQAKVGLPETKLGIFPGWGGTVRLSRLCGADNAIEWIATGEQWNAEVALKTGAVDAVAAPDQLRAVATRMLQDAASGKLDWKARREEKKGPLKLNAIEATMVFEGAKGFVGQGRSELPGTGSRDRSDAERRRQGS